MIDLSLRRAPNSRKIGVLRPGVVTHAYLGRQMSGYDVFCRWWKVIGENIHLGEVLRRGQFTAALQLRARLEVRHELQTHLKRDRIWTQAWERGALHGFEEVEALYQLLVEMIDLL